VFLFVKPDRRPQLLPQITPPFITFVNSAEPEVQDIVLRALTLLVQEYPKALSKEIRSFCFKYNDSSLVKRGTLNIVVGDREDCAENFRS
jgi:hypothetical protein